MNVPEDKQTVILLLQQLIDKKWSIHYQDYNDRTAMAQDRRRRDKFKTLAKQMLQKFKGVEYSQNHLQEAIRSVERLKFKLEGELWQLDYIPGQYAPVEVHQHIYTLLVRYLDTLIGIPKAELTSITWNIKCPYCSWPNRVQEKETWIDCKSCYVSFRFPEE